MATNYLIVVVDSMITITNYFQKVKFSAHTGTKRMEEKGIMLHTSRIPVSFTKRQEGYQ